jgi:DNA-directed RNA polymerase subunit RPC12/RpoP
MSVRKIKWSKSKSESSKSSSSDIYDTINSPQSPNIEEIPITPVTPVTPVTSECKPKNIERKIILSDKFEGVYTTDYDILNIHHSILHKFDNKLKELPILISKLNNYKKLYDGTVKAITRKLIAADIKTLEDEICNIQNQTLKNEYLELTEHLIPEYKELAIDKKVISFKVKKNISIEELKIKIEIQNKRLRVISNYLDIAKKYIKINLIQESQKKNECTQCSFNYNLIEDDLEYCPNCGLEHKIILKMPSHSESSSSKATDEKNFIKEIKRFQGMQNIKISKSLIEDLDKFFISYGMKSGEEIKLLPLNEDGERIGTSHDMLRDALDKTSNSTFYEDINLIANVYWAYPLPDISHIEAKIMDDYKVTQKAFLEIQKNRTSSLNTQYRLYKHLQLAGWNCKQKQFKGIKTESIAQKYAELWRQMCELSHLEYIPD